jgi:hypothetical protein
MTDMNECISILMIELILEDFFVVLFFFLVFGFWVFPLNIVESI